MSLMQWFKNLFSSRPPAAPKASGQSYKGKVPGRNEPCWCGSGKKYKQCHIRTDTAERVEAQFVAMAAKQGKGPDAVTRGGGKPKPKGPAEFKEWKGGPKAGK